MGVLGVSALAVVMTGGLATPVAAAATSAATAGTATAATAGSAIAVSGTVAASQTGTIVASGALAASGPIAWLVVGAEANATSTITSAQITLDCWKPVLHDESIEPSRGKRLQDLVEDVRIKRAYITDAPLTNGIPSIKLVNTWDEEFEIKYSFTHPKTGEAFLHATQI